MRLPRNAKIFRGQLDTAPFAGLAFLLVLFIVFQSKLVFTPGVQVKLPIVQSSLSGVEGTTVVVAVDRHGQIYYESQAVTDPNDLRRRWAARVKQSKQPVILEVMADKSATLEATAPVLALAGEVGMSKAILVTRPQLAPGRSRP